MAESSNTLQFEDRLRGRGVARPRRPWLTLRGRVMIAIATLLTVALATSAWGFVYRAKQQLVNLVGQNGRELTNTLAAASADALRLGHVGDLKRLGDEVVDGRNVLAVGFLDATGKPIAVVQREGAAPLGLTMLPDLQQLTQVRENITPSGEPYLSVWEPVIHGHGDGKERLVGYVGVGVTAVREEAHLQRIAWWGAALGGLIMLVSLPLAFVWIHRIFRPIRSLLGATRAISGGDLETTVTVTRRDEIGELAAGFNDMVQWVKKQQQDLAAMNVQLGTANRHLETHIEQRTAQLEMANKRLSEEIAEKEDFLRAVSHDLNAPLRNIDGMVSLLLMKKKALFDEDTIHRLERVKKNVETETDLISELLELSRIKTRKGNHEPVEIEAMVWELRGMFENDLRTRGIDLVIDTQLPVLTAERARMRQVLQNLIDNAIKYMGDGETREIHVGCVIRLTEAEFYVRDTGIGIDPEDVDKVFHVFRRGKNTQATAVPGKGVGLASVKSIVETYSGRISVESKLGEGTTFRFTINGRYVPSMSGGFVVPQPAKENE